MDDSEEGDKRSRGEPSDFTMLIGYRTTARTPAELLGVIVDALHAVADDPQAVAALAIGAIESLFYQGHVDETIWPEVERLTREDPVFRQAMGHVWADHERVNPLLWEVGVWRRVTVSFVVFDDDRRGGLGWRAPSAAGVDADELPRMLRDIADALEQGRTRLGSLGPEHGEPSAAG